jgi:type III secretion protein V
MPVPVVRGIDQLAPGTYRLQAHGVRIVSGLLEKDMRFRRGAIQAPPSSTALMLAGQFTPALEGTWLTAPANEDASRTLDPLGVLALHVRMALERHLSLFVGIQEASNLFNRMSRDYPDLIKEMLRVVAPQRVADVLKRLCDEGVPIRALRDVFEAITEAGGREKDIVLMTEYVRVALRRHISERYAASDRTLKVLVAHPELEDKLRQSVRVTNAGSQLAVDPQLAARVLAEIGNFCKNEGNSNGLVLLCSLDVRRHLRKLTEVEFFELPVLSFQELIPDIKLVPIGQVNA